jgi:hypothetical protein
MSPFARPLRPDFSTFAALDRGGLGAMQPLIHEYVHFPT